MKTGKIRFSETKYYIKVLCLLPLLYPQFTAWQLQIVCDKKAAPCWSVSPSLKLKALEVFKFGHLNIVSKQRNQKTFQLRIFHCKPAVRVSSKGMSIQPCGWLVMELCLQCKILQGGILWVKIKSIVIRWLAEFVK